MLAMKKILFIWFLILSPMALFAQFGDELKHHVIIAVDEVMPKASPRWLSSSETFQRVFEQRLADSVLREGDYLSFIGFSTDETARDLNDYTYLLQDPVLGSLCWLPYSQELKQKLHDRWSDIMNPGQCRHSGRSKFSLISLAKLYAFAPVKRKNAAQLINKTYIVLLTDRKYNGLDIYEESLNIAYFNQKITPMMMQDYGQRVSSQYYVRQLNNDYENQPKRQFVDLCEYIPLQTGLTLPTLLNYNAESIPAKRVKWGQYQMEINTSSRHNPQYDLLQLRYCIKDNKGIVLYDTLCKAGVDAYGNFKPIEVFNVCYDLGKEQKASYITIDAWASLNDGIYNATVLTPAPGAPDYLASKGLSVSLPIEYEKRTKVLGMIPLLGALQFDDNQEKANAWVSAATIGLLLLISVLVFRRLRHYRIKAKDITLKRVY